MSPLALLVEDDHANLDSLETIVEASGFQTVDTHSVEGARHAIDEQPPDLAILDLDLVDGCAHELLEQLHARFEAEVIVVTGHGSIPSAVQAVHDGAVEYLTKPLDIPRLERALANVRRTLTLQRGIAELRRNLRELGRFDQMLGSCPAMQRVYDLVQRVARTSSTVFITGETGTGKDLVAQAIHRNSRRADKPFVAVNCGAIQPTLIESELFGHEAGSFTGAARRRKGVFEQARGGTLFLDEITEMPLPLQVKLLRVLETRELYRVGGERPVQVDVRLIAATNRSPQACVEEGTLRKDLLYRLDVFPIHVPPLKERAGDIELLACHFLEELNAECDSCRRFAPEVLDELRGHDWPGNVRELRNTVERAFILAGERITARSLHWGEAGSGSGPGAEVVVPVGSSIAEAERRLILATLERMDGDKKRAAGVLGISLKTLYNRLNAYGQGRAGSAARGRGRAQRA